jgi:hypothetical protein
MQAPDNFTYLVSVDYVLHTPEKPFCYDLSCSCHEDELLVFEVSLHVADGLLTPEEATDFVRGKGI